MLVAALLIGGCGAQPPAPEPAATVSLQTAAPSAGASAGPERPDTSASSATRDLAEAATGDEQPLAARAAGGEVAVYDGPDGEVTRTFENPTPVGVPLTFLVVSATDRWLEVQLPVRPNGSTGWVRAAAVTLYELPYSLRVSTAANTLELYRGAELVDTFAVATGTGDTPTPVGTFYLTELLEPTNAGYGPYAYGISAYSEVLNEFGGGPGQIGLHGTDEEDSIGRAASHGCIRMSNDDITALTTLLPLGTPIHIT